METHAIEFTFRPPMRHRSRRIKQLKKYWLIAIILLSAILLCAIIVIGLWLKAELSHSAENNEEIESTTMIISTTTTMPAIILQPTTPSPNDWNSIP